MILIWIFIAYGFTAIIVWGSIFSWLRDLVCKWGEVNNFTKYVGLFFCKLTSCMLCVSTWVGFALGYFIFSPSAYYWDVYKFNLHWFFDGMFSAGVVWTLHSINDFFENNRIKIN